MQLVKQSLPSLVVRHRRDAAVGAQPQAFDNRTRPAAHSRRVLAICATPPPTSRDTCRETIEWEIPSELQPKPEDCDFDLDRALSAVLGLQATVPEDAFTAPTLGTERAGSGVLIRKDGLVLTIGYLITEAESIWLTSSVGGAVPGTCSATTRRPGSGWCRRSAGSTSRRSKSAPASRVGAGDKAVLAAEGGRRHAVAAHRRRPPGIRRLLGIPARPRDLHRAGASVLGRRRADRRRRQPDRHRLAACAAFERPRAAPRRQHGGADRPVAADPRRHADLRPAEPAAAAVARALRRRGRGRTRRRRRHVGARAGEQEPG